jgi:hypothetical protein
MRAAAIALMIALTVFISVLTVHLLPARTPAPTRQAVYNACIAAPGVTTSYNAISACVAQYNRKRN